MSLDSNDLTHGDPMKLPHPATQTHVDRIPVNGVSNKPINARDHRTAKLKRIEDVARLMDSSFSIPGTPIRFGWDGLVGFIPGVGGLVTAATGAWIIREAYQLGASKGTLVRMCGNVAVDVTTGAIPLIGDLFDLYWKSNLRNAKLLQRHLHSKQGSNLPRRLITTSYGRGKSTRR
jgi:hypothetical protein